MEPTTERPQWELWLEDEHPIVFRSLLNDQRQRGIEANEAASAAEDALSFAAAQLVAGCRASPPTVNIDSSRHLRNWLRKVAQNYLAQLHRGTKPQDGLPMEEMDLGSRFAPPTAAAQAHETVAILRECLSELDPTERALLDLKYVQDLTDAAIAARPELRAEAGGDERSLTAQAQHLRLRRLAAVERLRAALERRGVAADFGPLFLDPDADPK